MRWPCNTSNIMTCEVGLCYLRSAAAVAGKSVGPATGGLFHACGACTWVTGLHTLSVEACNCAASPKSPVPASVQAVHLSSVLSLLLFWPACSACRQQELRPCALAAGNHLLGEQYIRGDVFSLYWGMMFGEPASYMPRDECETFHCEPGSKSGGQARLQTSTEAAVLEQGSETSTTGKWALPLNLTKTEQSETRALQGERRQQLREERRLRGSNSRARTK